MENRTPQDPVLQPAGAPAAPMPQWITPKPEPRIPQGKNPQLAKGLCLALLVGAVLQLVLVIWTNVTATEAGGSPTLNLLSQFFSYVGVVTQLGIVLQFRMGFGNYQTTLKWLYALQLVSTYAFLGFTIVAQLKPALVAIPEIDETILNTIMGFIWVMLGIGGIIGLLLSANFWALVGLLRRRPNERLVRGFLWLSLGVTVVALLLTLVMAPIFSAISGDIEQLEPPYNQVAVPTGLEWKTGINAVLGLLTSVALLWLFSTWPILHRPAGQAPQAETEIEAPTSAPQQQPTLATNGTAEATQNAESANDEE